ncbi:MAG: acyl-CoA thioesterase [Boseongicola sp.]|nr:acyl-CoA thioesterase [Boseongicola sp.]
MYPYIRAVTMILKGGKMSKIGVYDTHVSHHRAWPWDTDLFGEINHGRMLTLFELARWQSTTRIGALGLALKNGIYFPVAGVSVRYRKRIPTWQKYRVQTRFLSYDDRFTYVEQSMWQGDTCMSHLLLRAAIKNKKGSMTPVEFLETAGLSTENRPLPEWAQKWVDADAIRPWPPVDGPIYDS